MHQKSEIVEKAQLSAWGSRVRPTGWHDAAGGRWFANVLWVRDSIHIGDIITHVRVARA